jgi:site-specific DNA-methyltransferase (adenine-specific)
MTFERVEIADGRAVLYLGDCLEVLPTLEAGSVDAVVTDPPYPNLKGGLSHMVGGVAPRTQPTITVGMPWGNELGALNDFERIATGGAITFCSWHSIDAVKRELRGEPVGLVTWYKRNTQLSFRNRPHYTCEYAWLVEYGPGIDWHALKTMYDIPGLPAGCFASERVLDDDSLRAAHPTQKPEELMRRLVIAAQERVLDPFMGSGTTGVACIQTGRRFIGIEIEPRYFEIAVKRIEEAALQPRLFDAEPTPQPEQMELLP